MAPGFDLVAVHPKAANITWFVPSETDEVRIPVHGKVVVTRTGDGGRTYQILDRGLPAQDALPPVYCVRFA